MVNLSALAKLLQFTDSWTLKLETATYGADQSFFTSGLWGDVSKLSAVNFSLVPDPLATALVDKRGDPIPNQESGTVFQINYPMGTYRSPGNNLVKNGSVIGGADFYARPFGNTRALRALLEYDLYFPSNFPFNLGGKLPGLYGAMAGQLPSGCNGGNSSQGSNCWSLRYMWRSFGAGEVSILI